MECVCVCVCVYSRKVKLRINILVFIFSMNNPTILINFTSEKRILASDRKLSKKIGENC